MLARFGHLAHTQAAPPEQILVFIVRVIWPNMARCIRDRAVVVKPGVAEWVTTAPRTVLRRFDP